MKPVYGEATLQEWFDYFASCHAATILSDASLASCSKSRRRRLVSIGRDMLPCISDEHARERMNDAISYAETLP